MEMSSRERVIRFFILLCWLYAVFHCHDTLLIVVYSFRKSSTTRFVPFKQNITQESQLIDSRRHNHVFSTSNPGTMNIIGEMFPEIGYHIRRDCQRKGFAAESAKAVMDWAFRNTDYEVFYRNAVNDVENAKRTREYGLDMMNHPNWFDASYISWLSYDSLNVELPDGFLYFAPIVNWGKYREENGFMIITEDQLLILCKDNADEIPLPGP